LEEDYFGISRDALKDASRMEFDTITRGASLKALEAESRDQLMKLIPYLDPERYTGLGRKPDP
jgi:hypothetical protein